MQIFISYEGQRTPVFVAENATVEQVKKLLRKKIYIESEIHVESEDGLTRERKILVLIFGGAELDDKWVLGDVGVFPGSTLRVDVKEEKQPNVFVHLVYNSKVIPVIDNISIKHSAIADLRSVASRKSGLPVGVFRLVTKRGDEMFDCHTLEYYDVGIGETIEMETWDGWNDLLNLAAMGFTSHVLMQLRQCRDQYVQRYQMKVALYIAAHFGHVDLALSLLKNGLRPYDTMGFHPWRQWCGNSIFHIDSLKTPVHEAAENGSVDVMRVFVTSNVYCLFVQDGKGLMCLNLALRNKQKLVAIYLLSKQFTKVEYGSTRKHIPLKLAAKMRIWAERAKEKAYLKYGQSKSTLKRNAFINRGVLVGQGVHVDGFTPSAMSSKPYVKPPAKKGFEHHGVKIVTDAAKNELSALQNAGYDSDDDDIKIRSRASSAESEFHLPAIGMKNPRHLSASHPAINQQHGSLVNDSRPETGKSRSSYIQTGPDEKGKKNQAPLTTKSDPANKTDSDKKASTAKPVSRKRKERSTRSALRLAKSKTEGYDVPLPEVSMDNRNRPFFFSMDKEDPRLSTLNLVEKYRGVNGRENAIKCLSAANNFTERPWLHQVRMAMTLAACGIKRTLRDPETVRRINRTRTV